MPPRKRAAKAAPAPATPPLDGCKVALCGNFPKLPQATLKHQIEQLGGTALNGVTADATHLMVTPENYKKPTAKVKTAQAQGIHIVGVDWLVDTLAANAKQAEGQYLMGGAAAAAAPLPPAAAPSPPPAAAPTKKRGANGAAAATAAAPATAPAKRQKTAKADKDVKADSKDSKDKKDSKIVVPVDEACTLSNVVVHVDDDGVVWDASLNQTNSGQNNNKFYRIQVLCNSSGKYSTWTRWGRVGERGQSAMLGSGTVDDAIKQFQKKFRDKSGIPWDDRHKNPRPGKYAYVERNYNDDDDDDDNDDEGGEDEDGEGKVKGEEDDYVPPVCSLAPPVQSLMELIFNRQFFAATMSDLNYDANKLPLGKLSKTTISRGFQALKDLSALIDDQTLAMTVHHRPYGIAVEQLSNMYYSVIPHAFGRNRPPVIDGYARIKKEVELLESLSDMKDAELLMKAGKGSTAERSAVHPADRHYQGLGMEEMTALDPKSDEFAQLADYLTTTRGATHNVRYKVQDIFRIERKGEKARFDACKLASSAAKDNDTRLLWHGSRVTNFGGILGQGLRIAPPEAPVSGYMFGKGIYLADMSSKSAGYCASGISGGTGLLLLCEAKLGDPLQKLTQASYNAGDDAKAKGLFATLGQGRTAPLAWKDASAVHESLKGVQMPDVATPPGDTNVPNAGLYYNEYIVYDVNQVRLRYLFRVKM
ncbi:hypothetical protein SCUCBS95973_002986 [Sporothrix curviconia]|uniref:Poly [ADP-ribose] polymerase n=1 Tax=Sporothrix curviconia TaxID=1260050 RepID=A0ABP0BBL4_9PEZI